MIPPGINYSSTNENLGSICAGLSPTVDDTILAVAGSGDQAFALLESGARVKVTDINPAQLELVRHRADALEKRDYGWFLHNFYFSREKLESIRENLSQLEIGDSSDILELAQNSKEFNKLYLSNVFYSADWLMSQRKDEEFNPILEGIAGNLPEGGLIYVTNHDDIIANHRDMGLCDRHKVDSTDMFSTKIPGNLLKQVRFNSDPILPPGLKVNGDLTRDARRHYSSLWGPAVYEKI